MPNEEKDNISVKNEVTNGATTDKVILPQELLAMPKAQKFYESFTLKETKKTTKDKN